MFNIKKVSAGLMISAMLLTSTSTALGMEYNIESGDTLSLIGQRFGVSVQELKDANSLSDDIIYAGEVITVPGQDQKTYTVVRGDSLFLIAQSFDTTIEELKNANGLSGDMIYVGDTLVIPGHTTDNESETYTVVRGDSLFLIAQRHNTTIQQLKMANNLDSDVIYPGQVLNLVGETTAKTTNANNDTTQTTNANQSNGFMDVSEREVNLLARAVYGESRGETFEGQVAVAAVILNRVEHDEFPNTIQGVVYEPGQFCVVDDGQINLSPNESAYRAAKEALRGNDPTNGAIFFYNPAKTNHAWMRSRPVLARIGAHVFAR